MDAGYVRRIAGQVNSLLKAGKQFFLFYNKKTLMARLLLGSGRIVAGYTGSRAKKLIQKKVSLPFFLQD